MKGIKFGITAKILLILIFMVIIPVWTVGFIRLLNINRLLKTSIDETQEVGNESAQIALRDGELALKASEQRLQQLGETQIRGIALSVAQKLSIYLNGRMPTTRDFHNDPVLLEIVSIPVGEQGYIAIHDRRGINLFHPRRGELEGNSLEVLSKQYPRFWALIKEGLSGEEVSGFYLWMDPDGKQREKLMVTVPVPGTDLIVGATTYSDEFLKPVEELRQDMETRFENMVKQIRNQTETSRKKLENLIESHLKRSALTGMIIATISIITFLLLVRTIVVPIKQLTLALDDLKLGKRDVKAPVNRSDEIGVMARSFVDMASELRVWEDELKEKNSELEINSERLAASNRELVESNKKVEREHEALEKANLKLEAANETKSRFLSTVSHELRNPLTLVLGYLTLMQRGKFGTLAPEMQKGVNVAVRRARYIERLISDLLDLSRIESGQLSPKFIPVDISDFILSAVEEFSSSAREKQIELLIRPNADLPNLITDRDMLHQVFSNLLNNAVKYTPRSGKIIVGAMPAAENKVRFFVTDTGIGISPEHQEKVFERFYQVQGVDRGEEGGSGLGLAIVRETLELLAGALGIESVPGQGSTFWFELCLEPPADQRGARIEPVISLKPASEDEEQSIRGKTVLAIDDDPDLLFLIQDILAEDKLNVITAEEGLKGMDMVFSMPVDLILLDIMMPKMDGFEVCRFLKAHEESRHIPIVLVTGAGQENQIKQGHEAGADGYIVKPFYVEELRATVRNLLLGKPSEPQD